jgi:hypothetical protein
MTYASLLKALESDKPKTASLLRRAESRRETKLQQYLNGVRLLGFEELIEHLDTVHSVYENHSQLSKVALLISRSKSEFITALEATLSGFHTVAHDAMRAVMEVELLLRDFSLDIRRLDEWATADPKQLNDKFRPSVLRQRFSNHVRAPVNDLTEAQDYKGQ